MTKPQNSPDEWVVHGERTIYENRWVTVGLADITTPSGERFEHHTVTLPAAAIMAVLDAAGENVLMTYRHRFVSDTWGWELPGGLIDADETPQHTVVREILEETGYRVEDVEHVAAFEPMIGTVRSLHHVFVGRAVERVADPSELDEGAYEWVPLGKVRSLIAAGQVPSSGTLVGLLHLLANPLPSRE
jgi:8-oxo-dGTP pyrophosphatase MutT (NUDIX family)